MAGDQGIDWQLEDWIRSGIEQDERYTPQEIIDGIKSEAFQLFRYPLGIVVTQITGHDRLLVFLLSGEKMDEWKDEATRDLEAFAALNGIEIIEAYCRPGLEKKLQGVGWVKEQVVMRLRTKKGAHIERKPIQRVS